MPSSCALVTFVHRDFLVQLLCLPCSSGRRRCRTAGQARYMHLLAFAKLHGCSSRSYLASRADGTNRLPLTSQFQTGQFRVVFLTHGRWWGGNCVLCKALTHWTSSVVARWADMEDARYCMYRGTPSECR